MPAHTESRKHRSVSQINQYKRCPHSYFLSRVVKAWARPAAWLAQGSAVHEAAEAYERSGRKMSLEDVQAVYSESYSKHINEACETTPNLDYWFASGPYKGERDIERRYLIGLEQCEKYVRWYDLHPNEVIWVSEDGTPGIEIGFDFDLDGVLIRGFIDAVILDVDTGEIIVRDNKTGNSPGDDFQLGVYGVALAEQYGIQPPQKGDYWMGKSGKATVPYDIGEWTRERVSAEFAELERNIEAGNFEPKPDPKTCNFCDVSYSCEFAMG